MHHELLTQTYISLSQGKQVEEAEYSFFSGQYALGGAAWPISHDAPPAAAPAHSITNDILDVSNLHMAGSGSRGIQGNPALLGSHSPLAAAQQAAADVMVAIQPEDLELSFENDNDAPRFLRQEMPGEAHHEAHHDQYQPAQAPAVEYAVDHDVHMADDHVDRHDMNGMEYGDANGYDHNYDDMVMIQPKAEPSRRDAAADQHAPPVGPLLGVYAYISKKLDSQRSDLAMILSTLGGRYAMDIDDHVTHFIYGT
jgi:hypothetical protein